MARKTQKYQWSATGDENEDQWVSRSQKKRDSTALQRMGEALCELGENQLRKMPLPDILREAVCEWKRIRNHEGRRRQMQYIGRLMREEVDPEPIRAALDAIADGHAAETRRLQAVEHLRDTLMAAEPDRLAELCAPLGDAAEAVRELVVQARAEEAASRPPHAFRALFRKLRELQEGTNGA